MQEKTEYKNKEILVEADAELNVGLEEVDRKAVGDVRLSIEGEQVPMRVEDDGYYTYLLPYYNFESPTELAKQIIDLEDVVAFTTAEGEDP